VGQVGNLRRIGNRPHDAAGRKRGVLEVRGIWPIDNRPQDAILPHNAASRQRGVLGVSGIWPIGNRPQAASLPNNGEPRIGAAREQAPAYAGYMPEEVRPAAIVTGASRGIGAATAKALAAAGYNVAVNFATAETAAGRVVDELTDLGAKAIAIRGDVSSESAILHLFEAAESALGPVRALVNNAAITGGFARVDRVTSAAIAQMLAVNVTGTILCAREAVKRMSTRHGGSGGAIVNISSLVTRGGGAGEWVHYAASKGAVNTFTIGLAREVAAEGIRVNAVAPGVIDTELHAANGEPGRVARLTPTIPMQRAGTAEEVAAGVAWLLSEAAAYVNGAILEIGGGR
jgi:NAD(P)-dependent dehydrogenase (short-subunit alcohol dehydrogenase family)